MQSLTHGLKVDAKVAVTNNARQDATRLLYIFRDVNNVPPVFWHHFATMQTCRNQRKGKQCSGLSNASSASDGHNAMLDQARDHPFGSFRSAVKFHELRQWMSYQVNVTRWHRTSICASSYVKF
jgi:hypothetical protein